MSRESLAEAMNRLDGLVRRYWGMPLFPDAPAAGDNLQHLLARLPESGFDLNIGGNSFELVGRRHIDQIQYQFADLDQVSETDATIFITQQDFNAVFVEQRGSDAVWGGLAGAEYRCFGKSLAAFFACLADCFEIANADGQEGLDESKLSSIRDAVQRNEGAAVDGWLEYFYG
jgi:hypothetical protein